MLSVVAKIFMFLFLTAAPFLFCGYGTVTLRTVLGISAGNERWAAFLLGAAAFLPCHLIARRLIPSVWNYLQTFEHEMTHLLIGLFFLKIPVGLRVSAHEGGEVRQLGLGTTGQTWISLAPYFFPTVSLLVVVTAYFTDPGPAVLLGVLGWATAFHLVTNWSETSFRQPDLRKAGVVKTLLILPVMNLICYGSVLAFVSEGRDGFLRYWTAGFFNTGRVMTKAWQMIPW